MKIVDIDETFLNTFREAYQDPDCSFALVTMKAPENLPNCHDCKVIVVGKNGEPDRYYSLWEFENRDLDLIPGTDTFGIVPGIIEGVRLLYCTLGIFPAHSLQIIETPKTGDDR